MISVQDLFAWRFQSRSSSALSAEGLSWKSSPCWHHGSMAGVDVLAIAILLGQDAHKQFISVFENDLRRAGHSTTNVLWPLLLPAATAPSTRTTPAASSSSREQSPEAFPNHGGTIDDVDRRYITPTLAFFFHEALLLLAARDDENNGSLRNPPQSKAQYLEMISDLRDVFRNNFRNGFLSNPPSMAAYRQAAAADPEIWSFSKFVEGLSHRPARDGGVDVSRRPPRDEGDGAPRPPRDGGDGASRPPPRNDFSKFVEGLSHRPARDRGVDVSHRPPRDGGVDGPRPPRDEGDGAPRPPRNDEGDGAPRPPRRNDEGEDGAPRPPRNDEGAPRPPPRNDEGDVPPSQGTSSSTQGRATFSASSSTQGRATFSPPVGTSSIAADEDSSSTGRGSSSVTEAALLSQDSSGVFNFVRLRSKSSTEHGRDDSGRGH